MKEKFKITILRLLAISTVLSLLLSSPAIAKIQTYHYTLPNKLHVVLIQDPDAQTASIRTLVRAGAINESPHLGHGISHYLEHLVSGGSTSKRPESEYSKLIDKLGNVTNAYTTTDHTAYFINTTTEHIPTAITILNEWMFHATFTQAEFDRERTVIHKEMQRADANMRRQFYYLVQDNIYKYSPYRHPVLGYRAQFDTLSPAILQAYYNNWYVPENMILVVGGDFELQPIKKQISKTFGSHAPKASPPRATSSEPQPTQSRTLKREAKTQVTRLSLAYPTVSLSHDDLYALDLLDKILGAGHRSILYTELVEKQQLAYKVSTISHTPKNSTGYFEIAMEIDEENTEKVLDETRKILAGLKKGRRLNRARIKKAKTQHLASDIYAINTIEDRTNRAALSVFLAETPDYFSHYAKRFSTLKKKDLKQAARRYFQTEKEMISILSPEAGQTPKTNTTGIKNKKSIHIEKASRAELSSSIQKINSAQPKVHNIPLIFHHDPSLPKLQLSFIIKGGSKTDPAGKEGLTNIAGQALGKGTARMSKAKFQDFFESRAAVFSVNTSADQQEITVTMLSEDAELLIPKAVNAVLIPQIQDQDFSEIKRKNKKAIEKRNEHWASEAFYKVKKHFFGSHPYAKPKLGEIESIDSISAAQALAHHKSLLHPHSMAIVITGDISKEKVLELLNEAFDNAPFSPASHPHDQQLSSPVTAHAKASTQTLNLEQDVAALIMAFHTPANSDLKTKITLELLDAVLAGASYPGGRLHPRLRGEGLVYVTHANNQSHDEAGIFYIYALSSSENLNRAETIIKEEVQRLKTTLVPDEELSRAKSRLSVAYKQARADKHSRHLAQAHHQLRGQGMHAEQLIDRMIHSLTAEDILTAAKTYFRNAQLYRFNAEQ